MIQNKIIKLKKYLFLISILFFMLSLIHLVYIFLYNDSKLVPIEGWTVSEWLIGSFPSLNPLKPLNWNNKYLTSLLYRSLLKYDIKEDKIVSDLASCDIDNLLNIECYMKDNIFWSNWIAITTKDVIATYNLLKNTWVNKITSSLLEETEIEEHGNTIIFKNTKKDLNFLNIFFQPILSETTINSIGTDTIFWDFPTHEQIYSWDFVISNISSDLTIWITKIFLTRNEFNNNWNISKLIIKLFPNKNSLLQNKESINIFNDNDNIIGWSIPRLENHKYLLPQYVSLFINQNNIEDLSLRNFIFNKINTNNLIKILWEENFSIVNNPYLTEKDLNKELTDKNFEKIISSLWYIKKSKIIENFLPSTNSTYSNEVVIEETETMSGTELNEDMKELEIEDTVLTIDKFQEDSKYITSPSYIDKYNFITKDDILLEWNAWKNVDEVYINDYKLSNYVNTDSKFYYRLKESYNSIKEWSNNYKIYFVENWNKILKEEINIVFFRDKKELESETEKYIKKLYLKEVEDKKEIVEEVIKVEVNKDQLEKLSNLDEHLYYNDKLESFTLDLFYISSERELEETAFFIKNSLLEIWVKVELFPISISDLSKILLDKEKYDMLLTWVNLGYFDYNIFPYFHSSQVKNGYNFSNIKKTSLDILLEELKSDIKTPEYTTKVMSKVLDILEKEQIVKTLYTPKINLLIDKNIKNINIPDKLVNKSARKDIYDSIYIKEEKIINFTDKWFFDFFNFLFKKLNG